MKPIRPDFFVLLLLNTAVCTPLLQAQQSDSKSRPFLVPFRVDGKWGLMDTLGQEVKAPGFCKSIIIRENFSYYVITDSSETPHYWIMSPQSGKRIDLGELKSPGPALKIGDNWFYHFEKGNKSVLASPLTQESFTLDGRYRRIQSAELYDLKGKHKKSYLFAYDDNNIGTGDGQAQIFDFQLDKIGEMPVSDSALTTAFGVEAGLNSSMLVVLAAAGGITRNGSAKDDNIKLNQEFAIKRLDKPLSYDAFRRVYYLIQKQRGQSYKELVSDEIARFDWVSYRGEKLITIWFQRGDNHLKAYFDYNGVIFPKNKLMVPSKYYKGEEMQPFLFRQIALH